MLNVTIANNIHRTTDIMDPNTTIRDAIENSEFGGALEGARWSLNGTTLTEADLSKSFEDMRARCSFTDSVTLVKVAKTSNA